jgi:hypothetical protein
MVSMDSDGRGLRFEIAALGRGHGRRYPPELRRRIVRWLDRVAEDGVSRAAGAALLGVPPNTIAMWPGSERGGSTALVPIEIVDDVSSAAAGNELALVMPSGVRVQGALVEQVIQILRALG